MLLRSGFAAALALGGVCVAASTRAPSMTSLTPSTPHAPSEAPQCGREIENLGALAGAPMILLGELHGLEAVPAFAIGLACRLAAAGTPVLLAVEIPRQEQPRIDAYLASKGGPPNETALLDGAFWRREFQDGRSSRARLAMLETARALRAEGLPLRVAAVDDASVPAPARDSAMASGLLAAKRPGETVLLLVGDLHARTKPGAPWNPTIVWAGVQLRAKEPRLVSLVNRFLGGEAWICTGNAPTDCGVRTVKGRGGAPGFRIERFAATDSIGFDGTFDIGPATVSVPAREDMRGSRSAPARRVGFGSGRSRAMAQLSR
jgi:hypothetical protein